MKHKAKEKRRRTAAFVKFLKAHPPEMPAVFSHQVYKTVVKYARCAFNTGWNSGQCDLVKHED